MATSPNNARDRAAMMDGDICTMCEAGEWPRGAYTCPVCDAEIEDDEDDPHEPCSRCGDEHPVNVLDDGLCPACGDEEG